MKNWKRYKLLIIGGVLGLVALALAITFWMGSRSAGERLRAEVDAAEGQRNTLVSRTPFPSKENFEQMTVAAGKLSELRTAYTNAITEQQIALEPIDRSAFSDEVKRTVQALSRLAASAKKGGEQGMILRQPEFGFGRYLSGEVPAQEHVDRLMVQLAAVKQITALLAEAGVSEVLDIERETFDSTGRRATPVPVAPILGGGIGLAPAPTPPGGVPPPVLQGAAAVAERQKELFETEEFTVKIRAYEPAVWDLINGILASPSLLVVREVHLTNGNRILQPDYLKLYKGFAASASAPKPKATLSVLDRLLAAEGAEDGALTPGQVGQVGLDANRRWMAGGELLDVVLRITLYRLKPLPAVAEDA